MHVRPKSCTRLTLFPPHFVQLPGGGIPLSLPIPGIIRFNGRGSVQVLTRAPFNRFGTFRGIVNVISKNFSARSEGEIAFSGGWPRTVHVKLREARVRIRHRATFRNTFAIFLGGLYKIKKCGTLPG